MHPIELRHTALLVADMQQGFTTLCPRELPVPAGLEIVPQVNRLMDQSWIRIDASQDWHPPHHCSFVGQRENLYPPHCVQGTPGAEFIPGVHIRRVHTVWRKGYDADVEAYSLTAQHPGYVALLRESGVANVVVCGIATNICCYFAARDLRRACFRVYLVEDACAGIDVPAANLLQAQTKTDGIRQGIEYVNADEVLGAVR